MTPPDPKELQQLPIFPLPDAVLFPYTLLPLLIFEPRYKEMMTWTVERGSPMVIAQLKPGYEDNYEGSPEIERVAGVGRLVNHRRLPDGRYELLLQGVARVRLEEELNEPGLGFRTGRFSVIDDQPSDNAALSGQIMALRGLLMSMVGCRPKLAGVLAEVLTAPVPPEAISFILASLIVGDGALRQRALECTAPQARMDRVVEVLLALLPSGPCGEQPC